MENLDTSTPDKPKAPPRNKGEHYFVQLANWEIFLDALNLFFQIAKKCIDVKKVFITKLINNDL